jgi:ABC-type branched-subunit amino acid transport system ATPase component/ABC-type branched-subunit amino acid transport system permease subunit
MTMLGVSWVNSQIVFDGIIQGLAIAVIAVGVVLIYRATRIINFAVGNMGVVGAVTLSLLTLQYGVPFWPALLLAVLIGLVFGAAVEMTVIRRLKNAPRVVVLVATIGIAGLAQAIAIEIPQPSDASAHYPSAFAGTWTVAGVNVRGADLAVLILVPLSVLALIWFLDRTMIGKTVKACATNPALARLSSISPKLVSTMVWSLAAGLSTLSVVLIAGETSTAAGLASLGPQTLAEALAAAVIAGMRSFRVAVVAAVAIGLGQAVLTYNFLADPGITDLLLFLTVFVAVIFARREGGEDSQVFAFSPRANPVPERLRPIWWARNIDKGGILLLGAVAVLLPVVVTEPSRQQLYTAVMAYAICASSLTVLTGWLGQLSLGQMAFAGLAALFAARLVNDGVPFWVAIATTTVASALIALGIGIGSLRVRGLYLAVVTFVFALTAQQYFYYLPFFSGESPDGANVPFAPGRLWFLDFPGQQTYYYVVLAVLALVLLVLSRFRDSAVGRTIKAVRDNESAAAAYTVPPARVKLKAFALAGALAGLGGALLAGAFANIPFTENFFLVNDSLNLVAMVVIGGMGSVTGAVIGAIFVIGIPAIAPNNQLVALLTSSLGLLVVLLYFPRGLNQITYGVRDAILSWADRRLGDRAVPERVTYPAAVHRRADETVAPGTPVLAVSDLSVRFGGITAVDRAALSVGAGEIVGLIGANGAGKSTLMNAVGGFVPASGSVRLLGHEVSGSSPSHRASIGLGRTFQAATLFPELTVNETLLVALGAKGRTGMLATALGLPQARRCSRVARTEVAELVAFLGLDHYRDHYVSDLSTGTRRVVELAGLLALGAKVLCLDEPTSGLAQRETEAFGPLITTVQRELQASVLLIEHDMPLIMRISERVYCLETGQVIAEGTPGVVRNDPRVIASYLGTDERAISRSGAVGTDGSAAQGPVPPPAPASGPPAPSSPQAAPSAGPPGPASPQPAAAEASMPPTVV